MGSEGRVGEVVSEGSVVSAGSAEGESQAVRRAARINRRTKIVFFISHSSKGTPAEPGVWELIVNPTGGQLINIVSRLNVLADILQICLVIPK